MYNLTVLIPTYNKSNYEIIKMVNSLGVTGNCIVSNQTDHDYIYKNKNITVVGNCTRGVSVNRNILLNVVETEYALFIDDDCLLVNEYEKNVEDLFSRYKHLDVVIFSRDSDDLMFGVVRLPFNINVRHFYQVSKVGAPGIAFKVGSLKSKSIKFNEHLGVPNYFYNGEDSLFLYELINKKMNVCTSNIMLYKLLNSSDKSSYFTSYDRRFFESVGAVQYLIHKHLSFFYYFKQLLYYHKKTGIRRTLILKYFLSGKEKIKKMNYFK